MKRLSRALDDALKKWATTCSTVPSSTLSRLLDREVELEVSTINVVLVKELQKLVGGPKKLIVGVHAPVSGDLSGNVILIFPKESALLLAALLQGKTKSNENLTKADQLSLRRLGGMLTASYLSSLCEFLRVEAHHTRLGIVSTFGESVVDFVTLGISEKIKQCLLLETYFNLPHTRIEGNFILLLAIESIDKLLKRVEEIED